MTPLPVSWTSVAKLSNKLGLLRGLVAADGRARTAPFFITIDPTRRCNLGCVGCRYHSPEFSQPSPGDQERLDLPGELCERVLDEVSAAGTNEVFFVGEGEPFLHPDLPAWLQRATGLGLRTSVVTNGTLIDADVARKIVHTGFHELIVSLWGANPETHARHQAGESTRSFFRAVDGARAVVEARRRTRDRRPSVVLSLAVTRFNFGELDQLPELAGDCGADTVWLSALREHRGQASSLALTEEQRRRVDFRLARLGRRLDHKGIRHNVAAARMEFRIDARPKASMPCTVSWFHARVKVDGTVLPCNGCDLSMGNINQRPFLEIWNDTPFREFRRLTSTRRGLASLSEECDCGQCCHVDQNVRVHRLLRLLAPWTIFR